MRGVDYGSHGGIEKFTGRSIRDIGLRVKFRVCSLGREFPSIHYIYVMGPYSGVPTAKGSPT